MGLFIIYFGYVFEMYLNLMICTYLINFAEYRATVEVAVNFHHVGEGDPVRDFIIVECPIVAARSLVTGCLWHQVDEGRARAV